MNCTDKTKKETIERTEPKFGNKQMETGEARGVERDVQAIHQESKEQGNREADRNATQK